MPRMHVDGREEPSDLAALLTAELKKVDGELHEIVTERALELRKRGRSRASGRIQVLNRQYHLLLQDREQLDRQLQRQR